MFNLNYNTDLYILHYPSLQVKGTNSVIKCTWAEWCEKLTQPKISSLNKYENGLVIYGDVASGVDDKTGEMLTHKRAKENVKYRQVFSFDYDDIDNMDRFINNVQAKMKHFAYFMYSTYRHRDTQDKHNKELSPRFRLLVPVSENLEPNEYTAYGQALARYIGEKLDESCLSPIQLSALPTVYNEEVPFHWFINDEMIITKKQLESCFNHYFNTPEEKNFNNTFKKYKKRDVSHWRSIAFGVHEGERNSALVSIIGHLLRRHVDKSLAYGLVMAWANTCIPPIEDKEVNKTFKSIMRKHIANEKKRKEGLNEQSH